MPAEVLVPIRDETDIVTARQRGRELAAAHGFSKTEQTLIATAISEVARNILAYARRGEIVLATSEHQSRPCIVVVARDEGPGIQDVDVAMREGYSTSNGLGMGLPGAKRLMDAFDVVSAVGKGTTVTMRKCVR
ncbi:MAG: anti-sigma regulatory factor [Acidobacteria bacterium]|nr:anti-sigma regulatory factor [Acidobacteriota bacterium]